jgi:hypothetical protein
MSNASKVQQFFENLMSDPKPEISSRDVFPTDKIAKAVLTMVLMKKYKEEVSHEFDYKSYDGTKLPSPSGYNLVNAMSTYIDHGGDKTEAIEKFIDEHLRDPVKLEQLLDYVGQRLDCDAL